MSGPRRLVVARHAKAVPAEDGADDHARSLTERGRRDARAIAERLSASGWVPQRVLVSDSARTQETWEQMAKVWSTGVEVLVTPRLYHAEPAGIGQVVGEQRVGISALLVLGHNPGLEAVIRALTGGVVALPTAAAALLRADQDGAWSQAVAGLVGQGSQRRPSWDLVELLEP